MLKIIPLECPLVVSQFSAHLTLGPYLLEEINKQQHVPISDPSALINRSDWDLPKNIHREYIKILFPYLSQHMENIKEGLGYTRLNILNIWFQQYLSTTNFHDWHTHSGCNMSGVYYLELKDDSGKPEFQNIDGSVFTLDVKEGDIMFFPSHVLHRSPKFTGSERKTIIAFDANIEMITSVYQ